MYYNTILKKNVFIDITLHIYIFFYVGSYAWFWNGTLLSARTTIGSGSSIVALAFMRTSGGISHDPVRILGQF